MCAIESKDIPICPNCKGDLPVPGIVDHKYQCPSCGGFYSVDFELIRLFKTEMWFDAKGS